MAVNFKYYFFHLFYTNDKSTISNEFSLYFLHSLIICMIFKFLNKYTANPSLFLFNLCMLPILHLSKCVLNLNANCTSLDTRSCILINSLLTSSFRHHCFFSICSVWFNLCSFRSSGIESLGTDRQLVWCHTQCTRDSERIKGNALVCFPLVNSLFTWQFRNKPRFLLSICLYWEDFKNRFVGVACFWMVLRLDIYL